MCLLRLQVHRKYVNLLHPPVPYRINPACFPGYQPRKAESGTVAVLEKRDYIIPAPDIAITNSECVEVARHTDTQDIIDT